MTLVVAYRCDFCRTLAEPIEEGVLKHAKEEGIPLGWKKIQPKAITDPSLYAHACVSCQDKLRQGGHEALVVKITNVLKKIQSDRSRGRR